MSKCKKQESGRDIDMCEGLKTAWRYGIVEDAVRSSTLKSTGEKIRRIAIQTPKTKGKFAELYYCPFCGVDIDTSDYGLQTSI